MPKKTYKNITDLVKDLPHHSYSIHGKQMEPITLIIIGNKKSLLNAFTEAGWYLADSINFISSLRSAVVTILNSSYHSGPMWPSFFRGKQHQLGFERPTRSDTYRRRHHLRLWQCGKLANKTAIWAGTLSYDRSVGRFKGSLLPTHHISTRLASEENFLARTFRVVRPKYTRIGHREMGHINTGDPYIWDGKALVLDLSHK